MSPRIRQMLGLITVVLFVAVGASLWMEGREAVGALVLALAAVRLVLWARMQWALMQTDDE